ncbi:hypothetical protein CWATWH0005_3899 [Crocosphaera watsonii WH 0005]|uniref:Uncharacterized protein n=1 Tax=Crocosphaera watsonii WH 0005 TaxID=423472 RepID=T2IJK9_CROWT|nr:hypothetical protein CWATWH0005_3899 [Crocosphaera watsonii WH 0005]
MAEDAQVKRRQKTLRYKDRGQKFTGLVGAYTPGQTHLKYEQN